MIAAFDVHYLEVAGALAAAVLFSDYRDAAPVSEHIHFIKDVADYISGEFYRRELPCILALIDRIGVVPDEMIVDGYVMLKSKPGLGKYLFAFFEGKVPVIGVAKTRLEGASCGEVYRGKSRRPLYVTSAGVDLQTACARITAMHGKHRIPTLLKRVDYLAGKKGLHRRTGK